MPEEFFERAGANGFLTFIDAQDYAQALGFSRKLPEEMIFTFQTEQEFDQQFKGRYYNYDDVPGKVVVMSRFTKWICQKLGIDPPGHLFEQPEMIAKANTQAIKRKYRVLELL